MMSAFTFAKVSAAPRASVSAAARSMSSFAEAASVRWSWKRRSAWLAPVPFARVKEYSFDRTSWGVETL
jgi:hypothetical protein